MGNPPLKSVKEVEKSLRGSLVVAIETSSNILAVRWKDNKVVNVLATFAGKESQKKVKRYCQKENKKSKFCSQTWSMFTTALWVG